MAQIEEEYIKEGLADLISDEFEQGGTNEVADHIVYAIRTRDNDGCSKVWMINQVISRLQELLEG